MMTQKIALEILQVPDPCTQPWNTMRGDEQVRFCGVCSKNVYNLSALPRAQAEALVARNDGHLCIRMFKRADGTIVTADCSAVRRAARRAKRMLATAGAGMIAAAAGLMGARLARAESCLPPPKTVQLQGSVAPIATQPATEPIQGKPATLEILGASWGHDPKPTATQPATLPAAPDR